LTIETCDDEGAKRRMTPCARQLSLRPANMTALTVVSYEFRIGCGLVQSMAFLAARSPLGALGAFVPWCFFVGFLVGIPAATPDADDAALF
jgi:hypothetical protein